MRPVALRTPPWGCARAPSTGTQASGSRARTYCIFPAGFLGLFSGAVLHFLLWNPASHLHKPIVSWLGPIQLREDTVDGGEGLRGPPGGLFAVGAGSAGGQGHVAPGPFPPLHLQLLFTRGSRRLASCPNFCGQLSPSSGGGHWLWSLSTPGAHQWIRDPPTELRGAAGSLISIEGQALAMPTSFHLPSWREASQRNVEEILFNYILIHFQVSQAVRN